MLLSEITQKKIALGMFGISYKENYNHWMGWITNIDWRKTNRKDSLVKLLEDNGNTIDNYFCSYHSELTKELLEDLKPKKYILENFQDPKENTGWIENRHSMVKNTLNLFDSGYDYYILTRFDASFNYDALKICKIEEGINVTSKHGLGDDKELITDYFYIIHSSAIETFRNFINNLNPPKNTLDIAYSHKLHRYENAPRFFFMLDGSYYSHNCPLIQIVRS